VAYARRLWPAFETYHAHIYFVPEIHDAGGVPVPNPVGVPAP
jgi:hypothetical protein